MEKEEDILRDRERNTKKLNLIDNLEELELTPKRKKDFIRFYYDNLDLGLIEALDIFKKKKPH
jgi:hypothetical protein